MAGDTIDNLTIEVNANAEKAARMFDRLASSAGRLKGAAQNLQEMADAVEDLGDKVAESERRSGEAARKLRRYGKSAEETGKSAKKGAEGLAAFWQSLKRIAFYRFIRTVLKEITAAFKEGITNLYHWSDAIDGHFAASMDRLATSTQYLTNSLGAMVSPLIESLIPVLDVIIDKVVDVLNFFNMLVSAVSGADTYTVAKKVAAVWDDSANKTRKSAKSAADDIKRTILGFDEINKLVKPNSSSGGGGSGSGKTTPNYGAMFEEKPLSGFFKKISDITSGWPDWLKALMGVGTAALAIFGIPALLKTIWDWLKKLFTLDVPNWFRWLFGPKGNGSGDGTINLPDELSLPDAELPVDLVKDDWSLLNELDNTGCDVDVDLKKGWDLNRGTTPGAWAWSFGHKLSVNVDLDKVWKYASPAVWAWNFGHDLAVNVGLDKVWKGASPAVWAWKFGHNMVVNVDLDKVWKGASPAVWAWNKGHNLTLDVDLKKAWNGASPAVWAWNLGHKLVNEVGLKKNWDGASPGVWAWQLGHNLTVNVDLKKVWDGASPGVWAWNLGHKMTVDVDLKKVWDGSSPGVWAWNLGHNLTVAVDLKKAWEGASPAVWAWNFGHSLAVNVSLKRDWDGASPGVWAYNFGHKLVVDVALKRDWDGASPGVWAWNFGHRLVVDVALKRDWDGASPGVWAWNYGHKLAVDVGLKKDWEYASPAVWAWNFGHKLVVDVGLKKDNWTTVTQWIDDSFGGGNTYDGGGVGRNGRYMTGVSLYEDHSTTESNSIWDWWKKIFNKTLKIEQDILMKLLPDWSGTPQSALGMDNLKSTVSVDMWTPWGYWGTSPIKWLQMDDLKSTVNVDMWTPWWSQDKSPIEWLQMDKLTATVNVTTNVSDLNFSGVYQSKAKGGIFSGGVWTDIPQYAGGTLNAHGSLFLAGEAGPEIVGHIGGRTEILNKSQIASAMYQAVNSAMQGITLDANFYNAETNDTTGGEDFTEMLAYLRQDGEAMRQQNELLRQQNELLRQINEKEFGVSTAALNRAQSYMNRRAGTTVVAVGT